VRAPAPSPRDLPAIIVMSQVAAPSERFREQAGAKPMMASRGRPIGTFVKALVGTALLVGLSAFNAWWYWRDTRPLPDVNTISEWMRREQHPQAELALREHMRRSPHDAEARTLLARLLAARGDSLGCARQLQEIPYWWPGKPEALFREGQSYMMTDRAKDAEAAWLDLIKDDPLHPVEPGLFHDACRELLKLYAIEDRWEDAYPVIWTAYDHADPVDRPAVLTMRMRPELERITPKESIAVLKRYVAAAADDWEALRALARAELALGLHAEAVHHFQACLDGRPNDFRAWRDYLAMRLEQGDLDAFLALLDKAPPSAESEPETWMYRGVAREKAGDWQAAAEHFRKAIELNPTAPKYYYRLAMAEERLGLREHAAAHRGRTKQLNEARSQLPAAYADYFTARDANDAHATKLAAACKHLAAICDTLGWARAAQAWNRLAISP
jgi:tetratricopeptide (TPR) repeat protein